MASLFGSQPKVIPEFTGLQVNTSVQVLPIPIIYGSPRVAVNLIYYNGFVAKQVKTSSGGKGILSGGKGSSETQYFATIILAIGEGLINDTKIIYQDQNVWTPSTFPTNGSAFFNGDPTQSPWSYIVDTWPVDARPYKNTVYYGFQNAQLDASATVPQINLVMTGILAGTCPLNNTTIAITTGQYNPNGTPVSFIGNIQIGDADADPALVIYDFLTNATYGATFPAEWLDTISLFTSANGYDHLTGDSALSTYCQAVGLGWSVVLNNVESANSILDRWCKNMVVAPVWNGAQLRFIPYWDQQASGNPGYDGSNPGNIPLKFFTPYTTPIVEIPLDQILQSEDKTEDPIVYIRKDPLEVYNTVRVDFKDRTNFFNDNAAEAKDEVHIELYGPRVDNIGSANEFTLAAYANLSATMQVRRNVGIVRTFTWKMSPLWGWLDPMDIVSIPDPATYISFVPVRITNVEDDEDENVTITAEEFTGATSSPSILPSSPTTPPNQGVVNVPPSSVYTPVIFEPTTAMLTAQGLSAPQVILGASGGAGNTTYNGLLDPNWGGVFVWVSLDNVSYENIGTLRGPSTIGTLVSPFPGYSGFNPDNSHVLALNLGESDGVLASVNTTVAEAGGSLCVIQDGSGFELLSYTTATLAGGFIYNLTGLYRGLYGTTPRLFGAGSQFMAVNSTANFFEVALPPAYIGATFYVKLQSFNGLMNAVEDLSGVAVYVYTPTGSTPVIIHPPLFIRPDYRRRNGQLLLPARTRQRPKGT